MLQCMYKLSKEKKIRFNEHLYIVHVYLIDTTAKLWVQFF